MRRFRFFWIEKNKRIAFRGGTSDEGRLVSVHRRLDGVVVVVVVVVVVGVRATLSLFVNKGKPAERRSSGGVLWWGLSGGGGAAERRQLFAGRGATERAGYRKRRSTTIDSSATPKIRPKFALATAFPVTGAANESRVCVCGGACPCESGNGQSRQIVSRSHLLRRAVSGFAVGCRSRALVCPPDQRQTTPLWSTESTAPMSNPTSSAP